MNFFKNMFRRENKKMDKGRLPVHIAVIPDGNGRWAKARNLPRTVGHKVGSQNIKKIVRFCSNLGIKYLTFYAFSTENWSRPKDEVDTLMSLLLEYLRNAEKELSGADVRIKVIGDIKRLPYDLQQEIPRVEKITSENAGITLVLALNYGGRIEILEAVRSIAEAVRRGDISIDEIDEKTIAENLYTSDIPDPDLVIRTSGEIRSSNFLLWQSAYSEYCFSKVLWPDFTGEHLMEAVREYQNRSRRFGGI